MSLKNVKLSPISFNYYLLKIDSSISLQQISSKLTSLRAFDKDAKYIAVEFLDSLESVECNMFLEKLDGITHGLGLDVQFICANEYFDVNQTLNKPIVRLPSTLKSKQIFNSTLIVEHPVRSGIKIENDGDIIVTSFVSDNAEIIATGNIHVYGDCRGRLIAGSDGNKKSRIFVAKFNAELISIAGIYRAIEDKLPEKVANKSLQVYLDEKDRLNIVPLAT